MSENSRLWRPWVDYAALAQPFTMVPIPVAAPPCPDCLYWRPVTQPATIHIDKDDRPSLITEGVILCHAETRYSDFSCYIARPEAVERDRPA